jgi:hypothetical protein
MKRLYVYSQDKTILMAKEQTCIQISLTAMTSPKGMDNASKVQSLFCSYFYCKIRENVN